MVVDADVVRSSSYAMFAGTRVNHFRDVGIRSGPLAVHDFAALAAVSIARSVPNPNPHPEGIVIGLMNSASSLGNEISGSV
jgi:hypothetical protein